MANRFIFSKQTKLLSIAIMLFCLLSVNSLKAQFVFPFQNTAFTNEARIEQLVASLTIDEKINLLSADSYVGRFSLRGHGNLEGLHGLVLGGPTRPHQPQNNVPTTMFPQSYGLGETWDTALIAKMASHMAYEARYIYQSPKYNKGGLVIWAPNADLGRDPRWGRTEECFGEDAHLNARLTVAMVQGLQGPHPTYWKSAALLKHFLANSNEELRTSSSSNFNEKLFREYYAYPFYKGIVQGGARAMMTAYNAYNGIPCMVHPCLNKIVRKEWGMQGWLLTDGGALTTLVEDHKYVKNKSEGVALALKAGMNSFLDDYKQAVREALAKNIVTEADINQAVKGHLWLSLKLGLLDHPQANNPYKNIGITDTIDPWTTHEAKHLARLVAQKSIVLLKNEQKLLPLQAKKIRTIAVIGPRCNEVIADWYSGQAPYLVTALQGIRNAVDSNVQILVAYSNKADSAAALAKKADVAIVCVGNHPWGNAGWMQAPVASDGKEAVDRAALQMEQEDLVKIVHKANANTVMVLIGSFPFSINWAQDNIPAIVHITQSAQELGNALADVLFGKYNPAGRLTQTWVKQITDLPPMMDYDITKGRTYQYNTHLPLYPFGYGLSYSSFVYGKIVLQGEIKTPKDTITISLPVTNTSNIDGEEVVQLYIRYTSNEKKSLPLKALKSFCRVAIPAKKSQMVQLQLAAEDIQLWDSQKQQFELEKGAIEIQVGASSADIRSVANIKIP